MNHYDIDDAWDAVMCIPASDHETRVKIAFALYDGYGEAGRTVFDEWYQSHDRYDVNESSDIWNSSRKGGGIKLGTLFYEAKQRGWMPEAKERGKPDWEQVVATKKTREEASARAIVEALQDQTRAKQWALSILEASSKAGAYHPYLARKGLVAGETLKEIDAEQLAGILGYRPQGGREHRRYLRGRVLVAPVQGKDGLKTVELIDEDGMKAGLRGKGTKSGGFWAGQDSFEVGADGALLIGEGVATVLSAQMATGHRYPVVAALSLGNFGNVLAYLRSQIPKVALVLLADIKTDGKPDPKAVEVAKTWGAELVFPDFGEGRTDGQTDFNDLHQGKGLEEVKRQIEQAITEHLENPFRTPWAAVSDEVAEFGKYHGVVRLEGQAFIVSREQDDDTGRYKTSLSSEKAMNLVCRNRKYFDGRRQTSLFTSWLEDPERITYKNLSFKPIPWLIAGDLTLPQTSSLNLYQGLSIVPSLGDCSLIKSHIFNIWCRGSEAVYRYVMLWLARMFQVPGERGHTVLLLKSGQGAGKNIIVDMLVQAFGEHATIAVKPNDLVGQFNDSLGTSVLVFANEAVWGGDKTLEGALKTLVTDEEIVIEKKYIPKYRVTNCVHLIMASNNDWAAPIDMDDRRFVVLDLDESRKKDLEYFKTLRAEIKHGGREAFVHELLTLDIAGFDPRDRPTIEGHQATRFEAVLRGADSVTQWWIACLSRGEVAIVVEAEFGTMKTKTRKILTDGWEQGPIEIPTGQVFEAYQAWCQTGRHRVAHETTFGKKLAEMSTATKTRPRLGDKRVCCYAFENLAVCRATYDQILGFEGPWINDSSVDDSLSK